MIIGNTTFEESFEFAIQNLPIKSLIGKSFPDKIGIFSGRLNDEYYFVDYNSYAIRTWDESIELNEAFNVPTKEELMFLFINKGIFNCNCKEDEQWYYDYYWSSTEKDDHYAWNIDFANGKIDDVHKFSECCCRGVRKITS